MIKSILTEYGIVWAINRLLYSCKLKMLNAAPVVEVVFEKKVRIKRTNIFKFNVDSIAGYLSGLPDNNKTYIINVADLASRGIIRGFSSVDLDYGYPINWQLNPVTGESCSPNDKWYEIPDFDERRGDIKLVWEASRFTHFFFFLRAYMLTGDKKYYEAFSDQLDDWIKNNTYSYGANYKCGQECALRMINALTAYSVFSSYSVTGEKDKRNIEELVCRCYRKILSNFFYAHKCIRNNHTLSELCGLIIGAWCCEDEEGLRSAYRLLDKEIHEQFAPDGGYKQHSFNYQRFALQICECIIKLSDETNITIDNVSKERILKSALLMFNCQSNNGELPNYGSNDGALIFPVTSCDYRDFRPVINTIHAMITGTRLYESGTYDEELLWFGGITSEISAKTRTSSAFRESGIYTIRSTDDFAMICLGNYKSRPSHMHQMHFDLWYKGQNIFCDCGTYSYASELGKRLVLTESHNTVKAAYTEQMNKHGYFMICDWGKAVNIKHGDNYFEGLMISANGYKHKRRIEKTNNSYTIIDEVECAIPEYEILFHTPFYVRRSENTLTLFNRKRPICTVKSADSDIYIDSGFRSIYYMVADDITVIRIRPRIEINEEKKISKCITYIELLGVNE